MGFVLSLRLAGGNEVNKVRHTVNELSIISASSCVPSPLLVQTLILVLCFSSHFVTFLFLVLTFSYVCLYFASFLFWAGTCCCTASVNFESGTVNFNFFKLFAALRTLGSSFSLDTRLLSGRPGFWKNLG